MRRAAPHAIGLFVTLLAIAPAASAQPVITAAPSCGGLLDGLPAALTVELSDRSAELGALEGRSVTLSLECTDADVTVRATDDVTGAFVGQRVERTGRGLTRQLAIVAAELLVALAARPVPSPPPPPPIVAAPRATPSVRPLLRLAARLEGTGEPLVALGGGAIGLELALDPAVVLALDAGVGWASVGTPRGDVSAVPIGVTVSVRFGGALGDVWLGVGPSVEGAVVVLTGRPVAVEVTGREGALPWVALGAVAAMRVGLAGTPLSILLELEAAGVLLTPIALVDGAPGLSLGPARFGGRLGLALAL